MAMDIVTLGLEKLTVPERLELIESLWDSLPNQFDISMIPDWHLAELAKRRTNANTDPGVGKPWREVLNKLEAKP